ncbi:unnamed protein product [Cylicocyclus nassatus]|uniref:ZP domain-containing protein n=1 Tax=Cylicocyclus nassatus TaxID=53992 RepID=A0AA36HEK6_CYLNA|nr:unnamed protein product [Cylicocyclus nassatus]
MLVMLLMTISASAAPIEDGDTYNRLDMCRTLLDDENCSRTMPIFHKLYPVTKIGDRLIIRVNPESRPHYGIHSDFLPYNCHVIRRDQPTTEDNAFVLGGCPRKSNVAIYHSKAPVRIQFTMRDVLDGYGLQMSGNYTVKCVVGECSRKEGSTINRCPDYDHCEKGDPWHPDLSYVNVHQLPAYINLQYYPMYRTAK